MSASIQRVPAPYAILCLMFRRLMCLFALLLKVQAQNASFPLESVVLEGATLAKDSVLEIAGLRIGALVDKAAIEQACEKLRDSGIFQSITYRYAPGPKRGYALTLIIAGHDTLADATMDFPGIDENALWKEHHSEPGDLLLFHHLLGHSSSVNIDSQTTRHALLGWIHRSDR